MTIQALLDTATGAAQLLAPAALKGFSGHTVAGNTGFLERRA